MSKIEPFFEGFVESFPRYIWKSCRYEDFPSHLAQIFIPLFTGFDAYENIIYIDYLVG